MAQSYVAWAIVQRTPAVEGSILAAEGFGCFSGDLLDLIFRHILSVSLAAVKDIPCIVPPRRSSNSLMCGACGTFSMA